MVRLAGAAVSTHRVYAAATVASGVSALALAGTGPGWGFLVACFAACLFAVLATGDEPAQRPHSIEAPRPLPPPRHVRVLRTGPYDWREHE